MHLSSSHYSALFAALIACAGGAALGSEEGFDITGRVAEDQTPTGRFTTAGEISQILQITQGNWVAVREFDGQDLVYFTHVLAWRCGLMGMRFAINDEAFQSYALPECHTDLAQPNALREDDPLPYIRRDLGSVHRVRVQLLLDDLSMQSVDLKRAAILTP